MKKKSSCLIIGLGKIGMGQKVNMINNNQLTHISTIKKHACHRIENRQIVCNEFGKKS